MAAMKLEPFALERFFARHEFQAAHLLCASDCETFSIGELLAMEPGAAAGFSALPLGYTETAGNPDLRKEIAGLYQGIDAADILVFAGAEEAIFIFMNAALKAGDHLVVQSPCYQSLAAVAAAAGCRVTRWETSASQGWALDPEWLPRQITPATRAVAVNFPHNPSGYLPEKDRFERITDIARQQGLFLFSDEVYRFLEYKTEDRLPAACEIYDKGVSLGVMSKAFGLAGLRLGWVACRNHKLLRAMAELKDYTTICTAAPSEYLSLLALRQRKKILERNLEIITGNLEYLDAFFEKHERFFAWQCPKAGPVVFPAVSFAHASDDFCADLLADKGVLLLPGRVFGVAAQHFRIGFGRRDFRPGLDKISEYMKKYF
jgi:aspartate/methionine/tyrosine aminotransferase